VRSEGLGQFKKNPPHRDLNPRPSGLPPSALTTTLPRAPPHPRSVSGFTYRKSGTDKNKEHDNTKSTRLNVRDICTHYEEGKLSAAFGPKVLKEIEVKISCQLRVSLPIELIG
jgi:hypothetical protein